MLFFKILQEKLSECENSQEGLLGFLGNYFFGDTYTYALHFFGDNFLIRHSFILYTTFVGQINDTTFLKALFF